MQGDAGDTVNLRHAGDGFLPGVHHLPDMVYLLKLELRLAAQTFAAPLCRFQPCLYPLRDKRALKFGQCEELKEFCRRVLDLTRSM